MQLHTYIIYKNRQFLYNVVCILKLGNFWITFFTFFLKCHFKKRKVAFFGLSKKRKKVVSNYVAQYLTSADKLKLQFYLYTAFLICIYKCSWSDVSSFSQHYYSYAFIDRI